MNSASTGAFRLPGFGQTAQEPLGREAQPEGKQNMEYEIVAGGGTALGVIGVLAYFKLKAKLSRWIRQEVIAVLQELGMTS